MKKLNTTALILSSLVLIITAGNRWIFSYLEQQMNLGQGNYLVPDWVTIFLLVSILICFFYHIFTLLTLVLQLKFFKTESFSRSITFVTGFFSLFLLAVDVVMLSEIGKEYQLFQDLSGEWQFLYTNNIFHIIFILMMVYQCILTSRKMNETNDPVILKDEALFLSVHQAGISTAILGFIWMLILLSIQNTSKSVIYNVIAFSSIIILISYALPAGYWLLTKRKMRLTEWYDEKQFIDISRGSLVSMVLSIPVMTIIFLLTFFKALDINLTVWFTIYVFTSLLTFSGSTLYFSQRT